MDLSIIILSFNTRDLLADLMDSLRESDLGGISHETIVVDNGSEDGTQDMLKKQYRHIRLVENNNNFGFSRANNIGGRFAKGKYLLFLNSDMRVEKDAIKKLFDYSRINNGFAGGTAKLVLENGKMDPACHRGFPTPLNSLSYFCGLERIFAKSRTLGGYHQGWKDLSKPHEVDCISGACFLIKKELFDRLGGWDESFFMYGEDLDFSYRLKQSGYKLFYFPDAKIIHYKKKSGREKKSNKYSAQNKNNIKTKTKEQFFYTMELFYKKHYKNKYPKLVYKLVLLGIKIVSKVKS